MKKQQVNHTQILVEFIHKAAKSELRAMYDEFKADLTDNPEKLARLNAALEHANLFWLTTPRKSPDDRGYRTYGIPQDIIAGDK